MSDTLPERRAVPRDGIARDAWGRALLSGNGNGAHRAAAHADDSSTCARCGDPTDLLHYSLELDARVCWPCYRDENQFARYAAIADEFYRGGETNGASRNGDAAAAETAPAEPVGAARIVTLEEFAAVDEQGADPVIGEADRILIPAGGDVMFYGNGGAGKTTLSIDLACHLGAGADWLEIPVPQPRRVLLIESEGPRPLFRRKLARKLETWRGPSLAGRVLVFEDPWAAVTFAAEAWRAKLAKLVREREVDVLIAGPLTRLGMDVAGTLQEVRHFMDLVADVREQSGRKLTVALVHHENKGGAVSGAWEGAGDTLLHVQAAGNGHTVVVVQKARWDSERHGKTLHLAWADGDGFRLEGERNYLAEVVELLSDGMWRTDREIAEPKDKGGIGANQRTIRALLDENADRFESRTGDDAKALGRRPNATVWKLRQGSDAVDAVSAFSGGAEDGAALRPSLKGAAPDERTPSGQLWTASDAPTQPTHEDAEIERLAAKGLLGEQGEDA